MGNKNQNDFNECKLYNGGMYWILCKHREGNNNPSVEDRCSLLSNLLNDLELEVEDKELIKNSLEVNENICPVKEKNWQEESL